MSTAYHQFIYFFKDQERRVVKKLVLYLILEEQENLASENIQTHFFEPSLQSLLQVYLLNSLLKLCFVAAGGQKKPHDHGGNMIINWQSFPPEISMIR